MALQLASAQSNPGEYKVLKTIPMEGEGGWDYLVVDKPTQRLFISHGTCVDVLDLKTEKLIGQIPNTPGVHGIACVPEAHAPLLTMKQPNESTCLRRRLKWKMANGTLFRDPSGLWWFRDSPKTASLISARRSADGNSH